MISKNREHDCSFDKFCMNFDLILETLAVEEYKRDGLVEQINKRIFPRSSSEMVTTSGFLIHFLLPILLHFLNKNIYYYFDN